MSKFAITLHACTVLLDETLYSLTKSAHSLHVAGHTGKDESVQVEMWDVVDVGIKPDVEWAGVTGAGGKEQEGTNGADVVLLDASTINVYQVRKSNASQRVI